MSRGTNLTVIRFRRETNKNFPSRSCFLNILDMFLGNTTFGLNNMDGIWSTCVKMKEHWGEGESLNILNNYTSTIKRKRSFPLEINGFHKPFTSLPIFPVRSLSGVGNRTRTKNNYKLICCFHRLLYLVQIKVFTPTWSNQTHQFGNAAAPLWLMQALARPLLTKFVSAS